MSFKLKILSAVFLLATSTSTGCGGNPPTVIVNTEGWIDAISELNIRPIASGQPGRSIHLNKNESKFGLHLPENFRGQLDIAIESWESDACLVVTGEVSVSIDGNSHIPLDVILPLNVYTCISI